MYYLHATYENVLQQQVLDPKSIILFLEMSTIRIHFCCALKNY